MTDNFYDDWKTSTNNKKEFKEINFSLSKSIKSGETCIYCASLGPKCTIHKGEKALIIPSVALEIIRNPSKVLGESIIEDNGLKFGDKRLHFNTCIFNYAHDNCKNCIEGRFKEIMFKGKKLKFCYPILKENTNVIPIGFHWDFDLKCIGKQIIDIEVFPYDNHKSTNIEDIKTEKDEKLIFNEKTFPNNLNSKKLEKNDGPKNIWDNFPKNKFSDSSDNEIKDINQKDINQKDIKQEDIKQEDIKNDAKQTEIKNDISKEKSDVINILKKENIILMKENDTLKKAVDGLKMTIKLEKADIYDSELNDLNTKYKNIQVENSSLLSEIDKNKSEIKNLRSKIYNLENSKLNFNEKDKEKIEKGIRHFSNVLFESFVKSYENSDF